MGAILQNILVSAAWRWALLLLLCIPPAFAEGNSCQVPSFTFAAHPQGHPLQSTEGEIFRSNDPWVIYDAEEGIFKMWDTYWRGTSVGKLGIAYATSRDGINWDLTIDKKGERMHVLAPSEDGWDQRLETVSIIKRKEGFEYKEKKYDYLMLYLGYPGVDKTGTNVFKEFGRRKAIGAAFSNDGINWVKYEHNPVLYPEEPWEENFWQEGLERGKMVRWSDGGVQEPTILWNAAKGVFEMWYQGHSGWGVRTQQIGFAESKDGIHWKKYAHNPVLPSPGGVRDAPAYGSPHVIKGCHDEYLMFYHSFGYATSIGVACSNDGIHWNDGQHIPVIKSNLSKEWVQKWIKVYPGHQLAREGPVPADAVIYVGANPLIVEKDGQKEIWVYVSCTKPGNISFSRTTYMCLFTAPCGGRQTQTP